MNVLRSSLKKMTHISRPVSPTFSTEGLLLIERGQGGFALPPGGVGGPWGQDWNPPALPARQPSSSSPAATQPPWHVRRVFFSLDRQPFCQELLICVSPFLSHERIHIDT